MFPRPFSRPAAGALLLLALAPLAAGCADPADDPRATASREAMRFCPSPEEPPLPPGTPCIPQDPARKYAENHAYRQEQKIGDAERAAAQGKARALAEALRDLAGKPVGRAEVQAAAGAALGLAPGSVEYREGRRGKPLTNIEVGGGPAKVCVNGRVDEQGTATAEVTGRTLDGTCLPGLGGH
ncbi:precorrin-3B C(17)-methyltransferase [Streptomyces sp. NPDC048330]|uniref:precorrin-3B C(17)-methyltransferase n=1 Tax=Streptomyces sp. NPDC048330 TaxID=3365533 RepID=UPI00371A6FB8